MLLLVMCDIHIYMLHCIVLHGCIIMYKCKYCCCTVIHFCIIQKDSHFTVDQRIESFAAPSAPTLFRVRVLMLCDFVGHQLQGR